VVNFQKTLWERQPRQFMTKRCGKIPKNAVQ